MIKLVCYLIEVNCLKNSKIISSMLGIIGICLISIGITLYYDMDKVNLSSFSYSQIDTKSMATSSNVLINNEGNIVNNADVEAVVMEIAPASVVIPPRVEVYDGLTMEELIDKLNRNLGNDYIAGKGELIATQCLEKGVDPYVAVAIILHETGCGSSCSNLARYCNNVGGQKGSPSCNGGSYKYYATLDEGIIGFIDNLSRNYYSMGLITVESIGSKYAASNTWPFKINWFINQIRNN